MAENVGGIVWTAEMKTEQLVGAEKTITNTLNKTDQAFAKTGKASDQLNTRYTKTAQGVSKATKGMSRNFGMAGVQVQQFVGQIQGGQSALLALSQQGADLGIVLGAAGLGSFIGIAATAFSFLLPILNDTKEEVEDLTDSLRELASQQQLTAEQAAILSEAEGRKVAESLTKRAELTKRLADLEKLAARQRGAVSTAGRGTEEQERYAQGLRETQAEQNKLQVALVLTNKAIEDGTKNIITYNNNIGDGAETSQKMQDRTDRVSESLARQIIAFDQGEKAAMEYATAQALGLKKVEQIPPAIQAQINKLFELKQAQKDLTALENSKKKAQSFATGVVGKGMSEEDRLTAEMDKLDQLYQDGLLDYQLYQDAKVAIAEQAADQLEAIGDKETKAVINNQKAMASAVLGFISSSTSAIMSGMDDQSGAYKAMFALQQAASIASTILAAQAASVAALAPPPIGLGPIAGAGLSSTILGLGYASAGIQAGLAIGGGRINGGPVYPGMMHPVTEDGRPELLIQGGQQYLLPGSRGGEVVSNKDMNKAGGGQPNVNVNIITPPGMTADVQTKSSSQGIDINATISAVADNIINGGRVYSAMQKTTKSKSRTG